MLAYTSFSVSVCQTNVWPINDIFTMKSVLETLGMDDPKLMACPASLVRSTRDKSISIIIMKIVTGTFSAHYGPDSVLYIDFM